MKTPKFLQLLFGLVIFIAMFLTLEACKKKNENPEPSGKNVFKADSAVFGTWQDPNDTFEYIEFVPDSNKTCYILRKWLVKSKYLIPFYFGEDGIKVYHNLYPKYKIQNDSFLLMNNDNLVQKVLLRKNNQLINYKTWLKPIEILAEYSTPQGFINSTSYLFNFGFNQDTLYYYHNFRRIVKYNISKDIYLDSMDHYDIKSFFVDHPMIYYFVESTDNIMFKSNGFNKNLEEMSFTNLKGKNMSLDQSTKTFYFMGSYFGPAMYYAKEGETVLPLANYTSLVGTPDLAIFYKNNMFLELMGGKLYLNRFDGNKCVNVFSYDNIPGCDYLSYISTNGNVSWLAAGNSSTLTCKIFKVNLD